MAFISFSTAIGRVSVLARKGEVVRINIGRDDVAQSAAQSGENGGPDREICEQARREINEYLSCERTEFDFKLREQGSEFSNQIYRALQKVPYGTTLSYAELAEKAGYGKNCARAVGTAVKNNELPLAVPCHRVVRSNGQLGGFSAGKGSETKQQLINMEANNVKK